MTNLADSPAVEGRLHPLPALVGLRTPRQLLREAADIHEGPTVLRIPKGTAGPDIEAVAYLIDQHGVGVTVADPRCVLPVTPALTALAARHRLTVTLEDVTTPVTSLGLPTAFIPHGPRRQQDASPSTDVSDRFPVRKRSSR